MRYYPVPVLFPQVPAMYVTVLTQHAHAFEAVRSIAT